MPNAAAWGSITTTASRSAPKTLALSETGIRFAKWLSIGVLLVLMGLAITLGVRATFQSDPSLRHRKRVPPISSAGGPWRTILASRSGQSPFVDLPRAFQALRTDPEKMTSGLEAHIERTLEAPAGALQARRAQYVQSRGEGMWLINAAMGVMCLVESSHGAVTCGADSEVLAHGLVIGVFNAPVPPARVPSKFLILGLAPDWVRFAQVRVRGKMRTIRVTKGTYSLHASAPITLVRLVR